VLLEGNFLELGDVAALCRDRSGDILFDPVQSLRWDLRVDVLLTESIAPWRLLVFRFAVRVLNQNVLYLTRW